MENSELNFCGEDDFIPSFDLRSRQFFAAEESIGEPKRFASLSTTEMDKILQDRHSQRTKQTTNWSVETFKSWCKEKHITTALATMTVGQLDNNLKRFYAEARTQTGEMYSKSTLLGFRHSIERFLNAPPFNRGLKLSLDPRFHNSNEMLKAQIVALKRSGKQKVFHKPPIESEDLRKLKSSDAFSLCSPLTLLQNVWFHIVLYFCRRGREGQRRLTASSFKFETDAAGRHFVTMAHDEITKNHQGGINDVCSTEKYARMYETEQKNDGYRALYLYVSKLNPSCESFFQYPKSKFIPEAVSWYDARPLGVNKLGSMMKSISEAAGLSKIYTNHSVRATAITLWSNAGVPNRHIMAISGHRNEQSLAHYNTVPSTSQLHHCSEVLSIGLSNRNQSSPAKNVEVEMQQTSLVNTAYKTTNQSFLSSVFSNCQIENVQVHFNSKHNQDNL